MAHSQKTLNLSNRFEALKLAIDRENRLIAQGLHDDTRCMAMEAEAELVYLDLLDSIDCDRMASSLN